MNPKSRARTALLTTALAIGLLLAGCMQPPPPGLRPGDTTPAGASGTSVEIQDFAFTPNRIEVGVDATVAWTNRDPVAHTVTAKDAAQWGTEGSGNAQTRWLQQGKSWSFTFSRPGTYEYYCLPHPSMTGTVVVGGGVAPVDVPARVVPDPRAPPPTARSSPAALQLELETSEVVAQLADGTSYEFWTFNGTVPGPMLRIRQGDTVDFTLHNAASSKNPHSIDFHAVTGPGGGAKATQTKPGESTSFTFQALNAGLYVYHCATPHIPSHVANGMYGLILVEPSEGVAPVDREYFVVQGEIYTEGDLGAKGLQPFSPQKLLDEDAEYYLLNGRIGALTGAGRLTANVGETVRLYFGVGGFVPSNFHVIGEIFDRVYPEGALRDPIHDVQTTLVPAGGAAVVEFKVEVPGDYLLVDHWLTHAIDRGAAGVLHVEGETDPAVFLAGSPESDSGGH